LKWETAPSESPGSNLGCSGVSALPPGFGHRRGHSSCKTPLVLLRKELGRVVLKDCHKYRTDPNDFSPGRFKKNLSLRRKGGLEMERHHQSGDRAGISLLKTLDPLGSLVIVRI